VENKPVSSLVVSFGKALNGCFTFEYLNITATVPHMCDLT